MDIHLIRIHIDDLAKHGVLVSFAYRQIRMIHLHLMYSQLIEQSMFQVISHQLAVDTSGNLRLACPNIRIHIDFPVWIIVVHFTPLSPHGIV